MAKRLSVFISQSPSRNPAKRKLEEDIVTALILENGIDVTVVPNLYDLKPDSTGMLALKQAAGNLIVISWLYERAAHWCLDRNGIHGQVGAILLVNDDEDEEESADEDHEAADKDRVIDSRDIPNRKIYCLDFKVSNKATDYIEEVKRIHKENVIQLVGLGDIVNGLTSAPTPSVSSTAVERMKQPENDTAMSLSGGLEQAATINRIAEEKQGRRWYPVIDYSRCTNCMECIDFCLFGVYGVDTIDTILVEQPDNCRKGCPACSRVCPENAIIFPQHKTPAIAGSSESAASMKIDLSQLFGAPSEGRSAADQAVLERDEQLVAAGRNAVGGQIGLAKRHHLSDEPAEKDALDDLVDELNDLDL